MISKGLTYQMKRLLTYLIGWEVIFWILYIGFLQSSVLFSKNGGAIFIFQDEKQLWWLWLILPIIGLYLYQQLQREQVLSYFNHAMLQGEKQRSIRSLFWSYFFFRNAVVFLIIALAQPAFGTKKVAGTVQSMELILALDISNSMNTCDIDPTISRLGIAKRAINEFINKLGGEKIGITIFAGEAYTQLPQTLDYYAAKMFVNDIETSMISTQGTNIKAALENSYALFSKDKQMSKAVILVTDGEDHEEDPKDILQAYKDDNIQLAILGIGTTRGGLIPVDPAQPELGHKKNAAGIAVHSRLNPSFITKLADESGGIAILDESPFPDLRALLSKVKQLKRKTVEGMDFNVKEQRYQLPLAIALVFFLLYFFRAYLPLKGLKK